MEDISIRGVVIGVGLFVTLTIVSLVIITFNQMGEIYNIVKNTDTSIYNRFNDVYSMYNGKVVTGLGLLNVIKQYEDEYDTNVIINYPDSESIRQKAENAKMRESVYLKEEMQKGKSYKFEEKYNVTVFEEGKNIIINFERK